MCKQAHGDEELKWFTEFMSLRDGGQRKGSGKGNNQWGNTADTNGAGPLSNGGAVSGLAPGMAASAMTATPATLGIHTGVAATPAMRAAPMRPKAPAYVPKLNVSKLPATMKAPGLAAAMVKGAGMPGLVSQTGESFAKSSYPHAGAMVASPPSMSPPSMSPPSAMSALAPAALASPPANPKAASIMDRLGALQKKASRGICLQFEMGGCTKENCLFSHDIA